MYLSRNKLREFIIQNVENENEESIQQIAYDLTIDQVYDPNVRKSYDHFELHPGDTVFIGSEEIVSMPNDCIGFVSLRNSAVRFGIDYNTPVYYPGHRTRIFTRIKNESSDIIRIDHGQSLVSFMVYRLKEDVEPYRGKYKDQFEFDNVSKCQLLGYK